MRCLPRQMVCMARLAKLRGVEIHRTGRAAQTSAAHGSQGDKGPSSALRDLSACRNSAYPPLRYRGASTPRECRQSAPACLMGVRRVQALLPPRKHRTPGREDRALFLDRHVRIIRNTHRGAERTGRVKQLVEVEFSVLCCPVHGHFLKRHGIMNDSGRPAAWHAGGSPGPERVSQAALRWSIDGWEPPPMVILRGFSASGTSRTNSILSRPCSSDAAFTCT